MALDARDDYPRSATYAARYAAGFPTSQAAEAERMLQELNKLRRWKEEALVVDAMWDEVWIAAGGPGPLGGFKPKNVKAEIERLADHKARLREELAKHGWGDFHYGNQGQDSAVVALLEETA